ncbi:MAG: C40 family peptidase [Eubacterium sp.]|nr:C40 family peptidase [Eubacterium sp.]
MKKKFAKYIILAAVLASTQVLPVGAVTMGELVQQKNETTANLEKLQGNIRTLEKQKKEITGEIDSLDAKLVTSIAAINKLSDKIENKEKDINTTTLNLADAEEREDTCYNAMKKRIQYIYESGGTTGMTLALFAKSSITDLVSKADLAQDMYDYDRKCLNEYADAVQAVKDLKQEQETQKAEFETMKEEQEDEKSNLEKLKKEAKATSADYDKELAEAQDKALEYQELITAQNQAIQELEAIQRRAAEEAAARKAAAEAAAYEQAQQAAAAAAAEAEAEPETYDTGYEEDNSYTGGADYEDSGEDMTDQSGYDDGDYDGGSDDSDSYVSEGSGSGSGSGSAGSSSDSSSGSSASSGSSSGSASSGQDVIDYAMQFVGNDYVYGGNSLTDGVDCSGFVNQVYSHFGYDVARQSSELRSSGTEVSYADAQPGDIVCYSGHVGLYMGDGQIVHASDPTRGIISGTDATYDDILSVRRVVD